jgi:hypothetical protein
MNQKSNESSLAPSSKEVNHTTHWLLPPPQPYCPSYPSPHSWEVHWSTYHHQPILASTTTNSLPSTTTTNNIPYKKHSNPSGQNWAKSTATSAYIVARAFTTWKQFPNLWHNPYNYRRFQWLFSEQEAETRLLLSRQSCGNEGPIIKTKWSHIKITFTTADIKLVSFPHIDAMVITAHIDKWGVTRVPIDNGNQAEILFLSAFDTMGYDRRRLREAMKPLW